MITHLCKVAEVSKSGYYAYFSIRSNDRREKSNITNIILRDNVLKAFNFKNKKKGARKVKIVLQNEFNINYNLKRIRRIMKKFDISCPIRKANAYRRMMKATKEHTIMAVIQLRMHQLMKY